MGAIQKEIKNVLRDLQMGSDRCHRLDEQREHKVFQDVKRHFLTDVAVRIVDECPAFEYAIVDKKLEWMFLENHHNLMCATGSKAVHRLKAINEGLQPKTE